MRRFRVTNSVDQTRWGDRPDGIVKFPAKNPKILDLGSWLTDMGEAMADLGKRRPWDRGSGKANSSYRRIDLGVGGILRLHEV